MKIWMPVNHYVDYRYGDTDPRGKLVSQGYLFHWECKHYCDSMTGASDHYVYTPTQVLCRFDGFDIEWRGHNKGVWIKTWIVDSLHEPKMVTTSIITPWYWQWHLYRIRMRIKNAPKSIKSWFLMKTYDWRHRNENANNSNS